MEMETHWIEKWKKGLISEFSISLCRYADLCWVEKEEDGEAWIYLSQGKILFICIIWIVIMFNMSNSIVFPLCYIYTNSHKLHDWIYLFINYK